MIQLHFCGVPFLALHLCLPFHLQDGPVPRCTAHSPARPAHQSCLTPRNRSDLSHASARARPARFHTRRIPRRWISASDPTNPRLIARRSGPSQAPPHFQYSRAVSSSSLPPCSPFLTLSASSSASSSPSPSRSCSCPGANRAPIAPASNPRSPPNNNSSPPPNRANATPPHSSNPLSIKSPRSSARSARRSKSFALCPIICRCPRPSRSRPPRSREPPRPPPHLLPHPDRELPRSRELLARFRPPILPLLPPLLSNLKFQI